MLLVSKITWRQTFQNAWNSAQALAILDGLQSLHTSFNKFLYYCWLITKFSSDSQCSRVPINQVLCAEHSRWRWNCDYPAGETTICYYWRVWDCDWHDYIQFKPECRGDMNKKIWTYFWDHQYTLKVIIADFTEAFFLCQVWQLPNQQQFAKALQILLDHGNLTNDVLVT